MGEYQPVNRHEIEEGLSKNYLLPNRTICLSMILGPLLFLVPILFIYYSTQEIQSYTFDKEFIITLIYVSVVIAIVLISAVFVLTPKVLLNLKTFIKKSSTSRMQKPDEGNISRLLSFEKTFMIIRLTPLEGISLMAMVILFLAAQNGILHKSAELWLFLIPLLFQTYLTLIQYLTRDKIISLIEYYNQILSSNY